LPHRKYLEKRSRREQATCPVSRKRGQQRSARWCFLCLFASSCVRPSLSISTNTNSISLVWSTHLPLSLSTHLLVSLLGPCVIIETLSIARFPLDQMAFARTILQRTAGMLARRKSSALRPFPQFFGRCCQPPQHTHARTLLLHMLGCIEVEGGVDRASERASPLIGSRFNIDRSIDR